MRILAVRHGESTYNVKGFCNDDPSVPVPLTRRGILQAEQVARKLSRNSIEVIITSQLPRAQQTAQIISRHIPAPIHIDPRLNDRKTGFEGKPALHFRQALDYDRISGKLPGGESYLEEKGRIQSFLEDITSTNHNTVLLVGHEEPLRIITGIIEGLTDSQILSLEIQHCTILEFEMEQKAC